MKRKVQKKETSKQKTERKRARRNADRVAKKYILPAIVFALIAFIAAMVYRYGLGEKKTTSVQKEAVKRLLKEYAEKKRAGGKKKELEADAQKKEQKTEKSPEEKLSE
ncbi:MAG: uncharacterized protein A8A55_2225 [Amphiamblys sp. WSBS2006]|nr:MAG: uncharacterized protein A8A55_2225 [Amphiamblys sp. WSBS2006]